MTCFSFQSKAQEVTKPLSISGVALDAETMQGVPFTTVSVGDGRRGTICDNSGYFSILAMPADTLHFRSVGYKPMDFVLPKELSGDRYSVIQLMVKDTIMLEEVVVHAFPSEQSLQSAFQISAPVRPLQQETQRMQHEVRKVMVQSYNQDKYYYDQWRYAKMYNMNGTMPPNNWLNPMTWSNFIRDWSSGYYEKKK